MSKPWFKLSTDKWLDGSTRRELSDAERAKWIDLLALCARYNYEGKKIQQVGVIKMTVADLAWFWREEEGKTRAVLEKMESVGKIKVHEKEVEILNWKTYNPHRMEMWREDHPKDDFVTTCDDLCPSVSKSESEKERYM